MAGRKASSDSVSSEQPKESAFAEFGLGKTVRAICEEIRELYQWDQVPWVVGYSGGKDSTAILQLIWIAIQDLPPKQRTKPIHVISTDTLVEQPLVAAWVDASHAKMMEAANAQQMPVSPHIGAPVRRLGEVYLTLGKAIGWYIQFIGRVRRPAKSTGWRSSGAEEACLFRAACLFN